MVIQGQVQRDAWFAPTSGVKQGYPLSPTFFAIIVSLSRKLSQLSPHTTVLLYADDLVIHIHRSPSEVACLLLSQLKYPPPLVLPFHFLSVYFFRFYFVHG